MSAYLVKQSCIHSIISYLATDEKALQCFPGQTPATLPDLGRGLWALNKLSLIGRYGDYKGFLGDDPEEFTPAFLERPIHLVADNVSELHYQCAEELAVEEVLFSELTALYEYLKEASKESRAKAHADAEKAEREAAAAEKLAWQKAHGVDPDERDEQKQARQALKSIGYNARQVTVSRKYPYSARFTIRDVSVNYSKVKAIAKEFDVHASIDYREDVEKEIRAPYIEAVTRAIESATAEPGLCVKVEGTDYTIHHNQGHELNLWINRSCATSFRIWSGSAKDVAFYIGKYLGIPSDYQPEAVEIKKLEVGKTYATRSICDSNCIFSYTVIKRTPKFVTLKDKYGETVRVGVSVYDGEETCYPSGRYSMAHSISPSDLVTDENDSKIVAFA